MIIGPTTEKGQTIFVSGEDAPALLTGEVEGEDGDTRHKKRGKMGEGEGRMSRFTFDRVFPRDSSQESVFSLTMQATLEKVLQGQNATVLAYGQTGSGKTYTMVGGTSKEEEGLIPRTIRALLEDDAKVTLALSVI